MILTVFARKVSEDYNNQRKVAAGNESIPVQIGVDKKHHIALQFDAYCGHTPRNLAFGFRIEWKDMIEAMQM